MEKIETLLTAIHNNRYGWGHGPDHSDPILTQIPKRLRRYGRLSHFGKFRLTENFGTKSWRSAHLDHDGED